MLTSKQRKVLKAVSDLTIEIGYPPSFTEIAEKLELHSKSTVSGHVDRLCEKGMLTKANKSPRSLLLTEKGKAVLNEKIKGVY